MPARIALKLLGKRLLILSILIAAFAIGSNLWQEAIPKVNPPPTTAAEWKLSAPLDCGKASKAEIQSWPETSGARRVCRAEYTGPLSVRLTLFDMSEQARCHSVRCLSEIAFLGAGQRELLEGPLFRNCRFATGGLRGAEAL
jgi:hypothetical protein